jgi:hypothetical protein
MDRKRLSMASRNGACLAIDNQRLSLAILTALGYQQHSPAGRISSQRQTDTF